MEIVFLPGAKDDLNDWVKAGDKAILKKIATLIDAITKTPYEGAGKPEPLKYRLAGCWSRRINKEHRLVYEVIGNSILIHSLKGHYKI